MESNGHPTPWLSMAESPVFLVDRSTWVLPPDTKKRANGIRDKKSTGIVDKGFFKLWS
jgi:hypothetical protein